MLPRQVISFEQVFRETGSQSKAKALFASLKLFPTPFKGIYYVPMDSERQGWNIDSPLRVLSQALEMHLHGGKFYYSCQTAKEFLGESWHPAGEIHVVNIELSGKISLKEKIGRNLQKGTYRSKKIAHLLSLYGNLIIFHKIKTLSGTKTRSTPAGVFATKRQLRKDEKKIQMPVI